MGTCRIDYEHQKSWSITENNAVGPTESMTLRTLDNAVPNNTNSIWLAMDGSSGSGTPASDANAGTQEAPVATLEKAIDLLQAGTPTKTTIHIFRNGYGGDLAFTITDDHSTPGQEYPNIILQVELGEIATITNTNNNTGQFNGTAKLNGIRYIDTTTSLSTFLFKFTGVTTVHWCSFEETIASSNRIYIYGLDDLNVNNCISKGGYTTLSEFIQYEGSSSTLNVTDCIIYNMLSNSGYSAIRIASVATVINIKHNTFYNNQNCIRMEYPSNTINITDNIFANNIVNYEEGVGVTGTTRTIQYNLLTSNFASTIDSLNSLTYTSPIFFSSTDFRLMDERRKAPSSGQYFEFTSKAVYNPGMAQTPSDDNRDLGAYDVSYTLDSDTWLSFNFGNAEWTDPVQLEHEFVNYQAFQDIRGNYRRTFDAEKRRFQWSLPNDDYMTTSRAYEVLDLLRSRTAKRFYPFGNDGLWASSGALAINADSNYDVALVTISDLDRNAYLGYICKCSSGANDFYLQIASNANGALVLRDHRLNQGTVPDGTYNVVNQYLPIEFDHQSKAMDFIDYNPETNPLYPTYDPSWIEGYEAVGTNAEKTWVGAVRTLTFKETEEDE